MCSSSARQVGSALDAAHARGLVHRDVKPANILMAKQPGGGEHAYLCDFGLAKHASTVSSLTGDRAIVGTVDYVAPEQIEGRPVDGRVDVYGLGCVAYECLTGEPPFQRGNELASLLAHVNDPVPVPSDRIAELPEAVDAVIARALAKDRDDRFASAGAFVEALDAALAGQQPAPAARVGRAAAVRTFLFADVRGYTSYTRQHGDEAGAALAARFAGVVRDLAPSHEGHLQELRGDEALVVFDSARQALRFALALQARANVDLERPVGIGLDAGEAVPVEEGFRGGALNRAARLCALAKAGEVLASDAVAELAGTAAGVTYGFRRTERLKGFEKPVGVVEIHPTESAPKRELGRRVKARALGPRPRRRLGAYGAAVGAVAVVAIAVMALTGSGSTSPQAKSVVVLELASGSVDESFDAGGEFDRIVTSDDALYGMDFAGGLIARMDPATATITNRHAVPGFKPNQVAPMVAYGSIWAADSRKTQVLRLDPRQPGSPIAIPLPNPTASDEPQSAQGVAVTDDGIWVSYGNPQRIARIDPATNRVVVSRKLDGAALYVGSLLASDGRVLWVVQRDAHLLWRIDPRSGDTLTTGKIGNDTVEDAAVAAGYLWVALETASGVWKVDDRGITIAKVNTGKLPWAVVPVADAVWVSNANGGTVTRIDVATDQTSTSELGHRPLGMAAHGETMFVSLGVSATDARSVITGSQILTTAVIGDPGASMIDPAGEVTTSSDGPALVHTTGAGLMRYVVAPNGSARVVPDIAAARPTVSRDGLSYSFTVRPGFRFSPPSDEVVTAAGMRASIERARAQDDYCAYVLGVIKKIVVAGNRIVFTLNAVTGDLPARLSHPCATAVPVGTPVVPGGTTQPIASAGPYYVDTHVPGQQIVVLRNPNYGGTRAQQLDAIVIGLGYASDEAVEAVERGDVDLVTGELPPTGLIAPGGELERTYGAKAAGEQRYFRVPQTSTRNLTLNFWRGPLRDERLRRAVSLALDRAALAPVFRGTPFATMTPPGIPGAIEPTASDAKPSLARAKALIGSRRVTLDLIHLPDFPEQAQVAQLVRRDLARVGISVRIRTDPEAIRIAHDSTEGIDILLLGWSSDFPDPGDTVVEQTFGLSNIWAKPDGAKDPPWLARAAEARGVTSPARIPTIRAVDRELSRIHVPQAVYSVHLGRPSFVSERVGCLRFLPLLEGLPELAALCLRDENGAEPKTS